MQPNILMDQPEKSNATKHSYGLTTKKVMQPNILMDQPQKVMQPNIFFGQPEKSNAI